MKPNKSKSKPKVKSKSKGSKQTNKEQKQLSNPSQPQSNHEKSKSIRTRLEQIEEKLKTGSPPELIITQQVMGDLEEGCKCAATTKQICARLIIELYDRPTVRDRLLSIKDQIVPVILDVLVYMKERTVTDLVQEALEKGYANLDCLDLGQVFKKWAINQKSTFLAMLLDNILILMQKNAHHKKYSRMSRNFVIQLTKVLINLEFQIDHKNAQKLLAGVKYYLNSEAVNFSHMEDRAEVMLLFQWAYHSCSERCSNRIFFGHLMKLVKQQLKNKNGQILCFISCLLQAYPEAPLKNSKQKFIVLIKYQQIFLTLIQSPDLENNIPQKGFGMIVDGMLRLAIFCDEAKKNYNLEKIMKEVEEVLGDQSKADQWSIDTCQSALYRIIISIEKVLPNYPLKLYHDGIIRKPGLFHLHLIDDILDKRQPFEVKNFMLALVEKWIHNDLRDFNILANTAKLLLCYVKKSEQHIQMLLQFFTELSMEALIQLNSIFFQASFPQFSKNQLYHSIPPNLNLLEQESQIKACGYAGKTLFLDRVFYIARELSSWSVLLQEVYEDWLYYSIKYFYTLLSSSIVMAASRIDKLLKHWQQCILKSKRKQVYSIFQIISVLPVQSLSHQNLCLIVRVLVDDPQRLMSLSESNSNLALKQTIKEIEAHVDLFQNYKKQEQVNKKTYWHFISLILRMFQKITTTPADVYTLIPSRISYEQVIETIKKYYQAMLNNGNAICLMPPPCFRIIRLLSLKAGRNIFVQQSTEKLKNDSTSALRNKIEIVRQLVFAYLQARSEAEVNSLRAIGDQVFAFNYCLECLKTEESGHFGKQILSCKVIALECFGEIFKNIRVNKNAQIFQRSLFRSSPAAFLEIKKILFRIIFRDPSILLQKYQRKLILFLRLDSISLLTDNIIADPSSPFPFTDPHEITLALWHFALDQQIELRLKVLNILTTSDQENKSSYQEEVHCILAVLTVIQALDPRRSLRAYAEKITEIHAEAFSQKPGFSFVLSLVIGLFISNSRINVPCYDIYQTFLKNWVKTKDQQYLFYVAIEQLEARELQFRKIQLPGGDEKLGTDLKSCYFNSKTKKGWINWREDSRVKMESILKQMKQVIIDKNKNARFLKSKKDTAYNWDLLNRFNLFSKQNC